MHSASPSAKVLPGEQRSVTVPHSDAKSLGREQPAMLVGRHQHCTCVPGRAVCEITPKSNVTPLSAAGSEVAMASRSRQQQAETRKLKPPAKRAHFACLLARFVAIAPYSLARRAVLGPEVSRAVQPLVVGPDPKYRDARHGKPPN